MMMQRGQRSAAADEDMPFLSADHENGILTVIVEKILSLEPFLNIVERQTQFSKKKLTWTREEREQAEQQQAKAASGQAAHSLTPDNLATLQAFLDALYGVLRSNARTQAIFENMDIVLLTLAEATQKEKQRLEAEKSDRASTSTEASIHAPAKQLDPNAKAKSIGGYDLMVRLLQSPVTRRYAIRQLESLLEFELKLGPRFHGNNANNATTPSANSHTASPHLGLHSSKSGQRLTRHASLSLASPQQLLSPAPGGLGVAPGGLGLAPSMLGRPPDRRGGSVGMSPMALGTPLSQQTHSPAAQFAAITRARSVTTSVGAPSPSAQQAPASSASASSSSSSSNLSRSHGVNHYIQLLLDLLHEVAANDFETRTLYLRSLRHICSSSPWAQHFFRQRSGFFNLYLLVDKLKVPELQRRKQLRKVTTKVGGKVAGGDGSSGVESELDVMRKQEDERLANIMLFVRQLFFTLTAAFKQNTNSRLLWSRFGYDRLMDVIYESEILHFPNSLQLIINWLIFQGLEYIPLDDRDCNPLATRLNPPHALDAEHGLAEFANATLLYMPLSVSPAMTLLPKTPLAYQMKVIDYLYTLARNDVANRSALGKSGFLSTLLHTYKDIFLSTREEREKDASEPGAVLHAKELRDPLMLFLRVLVAFTSSTIDVNALFGMLEEERWEGMLAPLIDMVDHGHLNGRLWPYVHFDLSILHSKSMQPAGACLWINSIRCPASGSWPPPNGYTFSIWLCVDQFSAEEEATMAAASANGQQSAQAAAAMPRVTDSPPIRLLSIESEQSQSANPNNAQQPSVLRFFLKNRVLHMQTGPGQIYVFEKYLFYSKRWYHVAMTHSPGSLLASPKATLYVNGVPIESQKVAYMQSASNSISGGPIVHGCIGTPPLTKAAAVAAERFRAKKLRRVAEQEEHSAASAAAADEPSRVDLSITTDDGDEDADATGLSEDEDLVDEVDLANEVADPAERGRRQSIMIGSAANPMAMSPQRPTTTRRKSTSFRSPLTPSNGGGSASAASSPGLNTSTSGSSAPGTPAGAVPTNAPPSTPVSGGAQWRMACCELLDGVVSDPVVYQLYNPNPRDLYNAQANSSHTNALTKAQANEERKYIVLAAETYHGQSRLRKYLAAQNGANMGHVPSNTVAPPRPRTIPVNLPPERIIFFYHAQNFFVSDSLACLLNHGQDALHPVVSHAEMRAHVHVYRPRGLPDSIGKVGGLKRIMTLLGRCQTSESISKVLLFLVMLLRDSPKNHQELENMHGYKLINHILKHKPKLMHVRIVDILFGLCGVSDECVSGHIANVSAFQTLFLDYSLWRYTSLTCKKRIFQGLINSITLNPLKHLNILSLRKVHIIPYIMSLLTDRYEISIRYHLNSYIMLFINSWFKEDVRSTNTAPGASASDELKPIADYLLHASSHVEHASAAPVLNPNFGADDAGILTPKPDQDPNFRPELLSDGYIKNCILETMLTTLLRINEQQLLAARNKTPLDDSIRAKVQLFLQHFDLEWTLGVIRNSISAANVASVAQANDAKKHASTGAGVVRGAPPVYSHTQTILWTLQILSVLIQCSSTLHDRFSSTHTALTLATLLTQHKALLEEESIYAVLLAMMMGKSVRIGVPGSGSASSTATSASATAKRKAAIKQAVEEEDDEAILREESTPVKTKIIQALTGASDDEEEVADDGLHSRHTSGGIPITATPSPFDYLLYRTSTSSAEGTTGMMIVDAAMYVPECLAIVCRMLQFHWSQPPVASSAGAAADTTAAHVDALCIDVMSFFNNLFNLSHEFRLLLTCSQPAFLQEMTATVYAKINSKGLEMLATLHASRSRSGSEAHPDDAMSVRKGSRARGASNAADRLGPGGSVDEVHLSSMLAGGDDDDDAFHVNAVGARSGIGGLMDEEEGAFFGAGVQASPAIYQHAYSSLNRRNSQDIGTGVALNFGAIGDDDLDPDEEDFMSFQPLDGSMGGGGGSAQGSMANSMELISPSSVNGVSATPSHFSPPQTPLSTSRVRSFSGDGGSATPAMSPASAAGMGVTAAAFSQAASPFGDKAGNVMFRLLCQVIFYGLSHDRTPLKQLASGSSVQALILSSGPSGGSGAPVGPSTGSNVEGWSLLEDALDLLPMDCQPWSRMTYQSRLLRSIAQRVLDKPQSWAEQLVANPKLFQNFTKVVEIWTSRVALGWFEQGSFIVMEVLISLLECPILRGSSLTGSIFSSVSRVKAKIVTFLLAALNKALLLLYSDASSRHSAAELLWANNFVLKYPKTFLDSNLDQFTISCLLHHCFDQIIAAAIHPPSLVEPNGTVVPSTPTLVPSTPRVKDLSATTPLDSPSHAAQQARELDELLMRVGTGAMQIIATLFRVGKAEFVWKCVLPSELSLRLPPAQFKKAQTIFAKGFDLIQKEQRAELWHWCTQYLTDVQPVLHESITALWQNYDQLLRNEKQNSYINMDQKWRAHVSFCKHEASEAARLVSQFELRLAKNLKVISDFSSTLLTRRLDQEDTERQYQEYFAQLLRDLKRLELQLEEKEEKHYAAMRLESAKIVKVSGGSDASEESSYSLKERQQRKETQAKWHVQQSAFWKPDELKGLYVRKAITHEDAGGGVVGGNGVVPGSTMDKKGSRAAGSAASATSPTSGLGASALGASMLGATKAKPALPKVDLMAEIAKKKKEQQEKDAAATPSPTPSPVVGGSDVPMAPPMDGVPMAPPMDGVPMAPPMAPPMGIPGAPPMAPPMGGASALPQVDVVGLPSVKMKKMHWQTVDAASVQDTVWMNVVAGQSSVEVDLEEFEAKFALKAAKEINLKEAEESKPKFVQLVDPRRSQNIEIGLSGFYMTHDQIVNAIWELDTTKLTPELIKRLIQFSPTDEELEVIMKFTGEWQTLGIAEKFFLALNTINHLQLRLHAFDTMQTLDDQLSYLDQNLVLVENATNQVRESQHLQEVLTIVLAFGNFMNVGQRGGPAYGFRLNTLTTLGNTKSADNKTTLLHYLVNHIERTNPAARNFITQLNGVKDAARIELKFLLSEVTRIKENVTAIQIALEAVQAADAAGQNPPNDRFIEVMQPFYAAAQSRVTGINNRLKTTQQRCEKLAKYLGEPDLAPEALFSIFVTFIQNYESAEAEVKRERELAETRRKNRDLQAKLKGQANQRERRNSLDKQQHR